MRLVSAFISLALVFGLVPAAAAEGSLWYGFTDIATNLAALVLIVFLAIVWRFGGFNTAFDALDARATRIEDELEQARSLREAATDAYAQAQKRQEAAETEAENIVDAAKAQADAMIAEARKLVSESLERKQAQLEARIARTEAEAIADVRNRTIELAASASAIILTAADTDTQIDATLKDIASAK